MQTFKNILVKFFGVAVRGQTYLNLIYLLLSFPLGLFYFIFLVVGFSVGIPLAFLWVGLLILAVDFGIWYGMIAFERQMAIGLLGENIPPIELQDLSGKTLWQKLTVALGNPVSWKGLFYLFLKFPLGTLSYSVLAILGGFSAALISVPFYYKELYPHLHFTWDGTLWYPIWVVDTLPEALLVCLLGILAALISLHIFNALAWVNGKFARIMLGNFSAVPTSPVAPSAPTAPENSVLPA